MTRLKEAQLICRDFKLTKELEVDRKILDWFEATRGKGVTMEDTLLCRLLGITKEQYWLAIARLHYLGVTRFPVELLQK